jgi:hypothetical protein
MHTFDPGATLPLFVVVGILYNHQIVIVVVVKM